jgi:hypothetical protein
MCIDRKLPSNTEYILNSLRKKTSLPEHKYQTHEVQYAPHILVASTSIKMQHVTCNDASTTLPLHFLQLIHSQAMPAVVHTASSGAKTGLVTL